MLLEVIPPDDADSSLPRKRLTAAAARSPGVGDRLRLRLLESASRDRFHWKTLPGMWPFILGSSGVGGGSGGDGVSKMMMDGELVSLADISPSSLLPLVLGPAAFDGLVSSSSSLIKSMTSHSLVAFGRGSNGDFGFGRSAGLEAVPKNIWGLEARTRHLTKTHITVQVPQFYDKMEIKASYRMGR